MSRKDAARLGDIVEAVDTIRDHLTRGGLDDGLVYDAVRVRLIEIGTRVGAPHAGLRRAAGQVAHLSKARPMRPWSTSPTRVVGHA